MGFIVGLGADFRGKHMVQRMKKHTPVAEAFKLERAAELLASYLNRDLARAGTRSDIH